jgi:DNA-binding transcriptional LysR family regulator
VTAETGHMTKAAEQLQTSQPFLSRSIQSLEQELNCSLFDRTGRGIALNEVGRAYYHYVKSAFDNLEDGSKVIRQLLDTQENTIRVGTNACSFLPAFFNYAHKSYKKLAIRQETFAFPKLIELLQNGDIDFIFGVCASEPEEIEGISSTLLTMDQMYLLFAKSNPCAQRESLQFKDIVDMPIIAAPRNLGLTDALLYRFDLHGAEPNIVIQTTDIAIIPKYVAFDLGISAFPSCVLTEICKAYDVKKVSLLEDCFVARLYLLWNHKRFQSETAKTFRQLANDFYPKSLRKLYRIFLKENTGTRS